VENLRVFEFKVLLGFVDERYTPRITSYALFVQFVVVILSDLVLSSF
jgi:hypothetical protein